MVYPVGRRIQCKEVTPFFKLSNQTSLFFYHLPIHFFIAMYNIIIYQCTKTLASITNFQFPSNLIPANEFL